jgi:hypothetical protein
MSSTVIDVEAQFYRLVRLGLMMGQLLKTYLKDVVQETQLGVQSTPRDA